ncbi:hypothetical protein PISL3812_05497 [Talaromyces islandicus]|uniref:Apple domain-containing protein n=1 Tax=Talaromyces islandicus TaxID=28573 RepID=A0A0U1LYQ8_TALIS|nr:hypothetical protein PISL3812_05497 [Talaromyces islandicus]
MESLSFPQVGGASKLFPRSSTCAQTGDYTAPDGLNFTVHCGEDVISSAYSSYVPTQKNFTACMDGCSTESWRCWGVLWQESNSSCWELSAPTALTTANLTTSDTRDIALANSTQLSNANVSCPYTNNMALTTPEGLDFKLSCNMEVEGNDLCPWFSDFCPTYAVSLEECMEACVHAHPLCEAAMWNPGHLTGYLNCFLKNATGPLVENVNQVYHTAVAEAAALAQGCPTYTTYTSTDGKAFNITCSQTATQATNITFSHRKNITACIDSCASHDGTPECEAVVFDATLGSGYENCQLLNSVQMLDSSSSLNIAQLVSTSSGSTSSSSSSSSSKAWIAAPVIGGVVAIVGIGLAWFWWNRRKRSNDAPNQNSPTQGVPIQGGNYLYTSASQKNQGVAAASETRSHQDELDSAPLSELVASERVELASQGNTAHELPA